VEAVTEVSPELFDLITRWSSSAPGQVQANSVAGKTSAADLLSFVQANEPALATEAATLVEQLGTSGQGLSQDKSAMAETCACRIVAAISANPTSPTPNTTGHREMRKWPNRNHRKDEHRLETDAWGAAHRAEQYRYHYHGVSEYKDDRQHYTRLRTQLLCRTQQGSACSGSCQGKMYPFVEYATNLYGEANTGGVWDKSAHAAAADGATLQYSAPDSPTKVLFDKMASVSRVGSQTSFNIEELANLVVSGLKIGAAIQTSDKDQGLSAVDTSLVDRAIKSFAGLISRSGSDGSTSQDMYASYHPASSGLFQVSYSSTSHQVHSLDLTSHGAVKNRGWGGRNEDKSRYASSYLMAVAFDNFQCDTGVTPPPAAAIWRYASTAGSPHSNDTLRNLTQDFFRVHLGMTINVNGNSGSSPLEQGGTPTPRPPTPGTGRPGKPPLLPLE
jgi:hypothetical protein